MNPILWFLTSGLAMAQEAAESGAHEAVQIPWTNIGVQTINFVILFGFLGWILRKPIKKHFAQRAESYRELVDRAENARREAEKGHALIKERLAKLESSADQSLAQARSEASDLKQRLMNEARTLTQKLEHEAQRSAAVELEKAKAELRRELLSKGLATSEDNLRKGLGTSEQLKLQNEFAEKIEVVSG